jgi:predicted phosphodiesterase
MSLARSIVEGKTDLSEEEVIHLIGLVEDKYSNEPNLIETPSNDVIYVGDLHGDLGSLKQVQSLFKEKRSRSLVFLGDYVDRGPYQIEALHLVLSLSLVYPERVFVLRGNHESEEVCTRYGFLGAVGNKYGLKFLMEYFRAFQVLPLASITKTGIFACHGGIPEGVDSRERIRRIDRKHPNFPDDVAFQMVWNDPKDADFRFRPNFRSDRARVYGSLAFTDFTEALDLNVMLRSHEAFPQGLVKFFENRLLSVFSTSYGGRVNAKVLHLRDHLDFRPIDL